MNVPLASKAWIFRPSMLWALKEYVNNAGMNIATYENQVNSIPKLAGNYGSRQWSAYSNGFTALMIDMSVARNISHVDNRWMSYCRR